MHFFTSTPRYVRGNRKKMPMGTKSQKCKTKSCQILLLSSKTATQALFNIYIVFCFDPLYKVIYQKNLEKSLLSGIFQER